MKKPIFAMALALTLVGGSFSGFQPVKGAMVVNAQTATPSGNDPGTQTPSGNDPGTQTPEQQEPTTPTDPTTPSGPSTPTDPTTPSGPSTPTDPTTPSGPATPTTPDEITTDAGETITSTVPVVGGSSLVTLVTTDKDTLAGAVGGLTEGQSVQIQVSDWGSSLSETVQTGVINTVTPLGGTVDRYLDIKVGVVDADGTYNNKAELSAPITFVVQAPEGIDGAAYDFAVARVHYAGNSSDAKPVVTILKDLDDRPDTITFATDRFSTYAVIYGPQGAFNEVGENGGDDGSDDNDNNNSGDSSSSGKDRVPKTGDSTIPVLPFAAAGAACAAAAFVLKKKEQA